MSRVATKLGPIDGEIIVPKGTSQQIHRYLGIPYARPPIGALRFRRPVHLDLKWTQPLKATNWPPQCPQYYKTPFHQACEKYLNNTAFSEDCLYLNIWSPDVEVKKSQGDPKPVLVYIHGGGLVAGTASFDLYDGEYISVAMDVVVVSFNYRVGTLGFIYTNSVSDIKGNQGLWDQAAALQWVHDNIANFGGDPDRVTIMGQSAGGYSVSLHCLSPVTRNLFQNAILMSGAATNIAVKPEIQIEQYLSALRKVGIASESETEITKEMVKQLETMDIDKLAPIHHQMERRNPLDRKSIVVIDGEFLPTSVAEMFSSGNFKTNINLLSSIVEDECSFFLSYTPYPIFKAHNPAPLGYEKAKEFLHKLITQLKPFQSVSVNSEAVPIDLMLKYYFRGLNPTDDDDDAQQQNEYRKRIGIALGDFWLGCPTLHFSKNIYRNSNGNANVYQWFYKAKTENIKFLGHDWSGVSHCDELFPLFGMPFRYTELYSDRERDISNDIIAFIGKFIKTGKPGPAWQPYFFANNGNDLIAPYYEINNEPASSEHFKFNCKYVESELIWSKAKQEY